MIIVLCFNMQGIEIIIEHTNTGNCHVYILVCKGKIFLACSWQVSFVYALVDL